MRIPSGDLAPMRKRRHGSSFRRRRRRWPVVVAVLAVLAVAAGAYAVQHRKAASSSPAAAASACPTPKTSPAARPAPVTSVRLPAPAAVSLRLLNGTGRNGLARVVGNELARRGFHVVATGNAPRALVGRSQVYYGPGGRLAALLVSAHVLGSSVVPVPTAARGAIDVVVGSAFVRLRTPAEVSAYARGEVTRPVPAASPSTRTTSCR